MKHTTLSLVIAALQMVLIAVGLANVVQFHGGALHLDSMVGFWGAFIICAVGVVAASLSASIHYAARHLYNAHYAAVVGALSIVWPLQFLSSLGGEEWFRMFIAGCLAIAAPWTIMHLAASASNRRNGSLAIAAAAMCATFAALHPKSLIASILMAAISGLSVWFLTKNSGDESPAPMASKSWSVTSFLLFNMITACGLGAMLGMFFMHVYAIAGDLETTTIVTGERVGDFMLLEGAAGIAKLEAARFAASIAGLLIVPGFVFLWPPGSRTKLTAPLAAACIAVAAASGGQQSIRPGIYCAVISIVLLCVATVLAADGARATRWPHALIAAAVAGTILLQNYAGTLSEPSPGLAAYFVECIYLAILWEVAYFGGLVVLRRRADQAAGITDKKISAA